MTEDTEELRFNTAIAAMMEFVNGANKWPAPAQEVLEGFTLLLSPYAPHLAEELWQVPLGKHCHDQQRLLLDPGLGLERASPCCCLPTRPTWLRSSGRYCSARFAVLWVSGESGTLSAAVFLRAPPG